MKAAQVTYFVEEIESSRSPQYLEGLKIYLDSTPKSIQTNADEISHWVDQYDTTYPGDLFKVLLLVRKDGRGSTVIGYLQFAYMAGPAIVFVDYICILPGQRGNWAFWSFSDRFHAYLSEKGLPYRYIVAEVNGAEEVDAEGRKSRALMRLLEFEGMLAASVPYYHPSLDEAARAAPAESAYSLLVIGSRCEVDRIRKDEYMRIVEVLYLQHYLRWYAGIYPEHEAAYRRHLDALLARTRRKLLAAPDHMTVGGVAPKRWGSEAAGGPPRRPAYILSLGVGLVLAVLSAAACRFLFPGAAVGLTVFLVAFPVLVSVAIATRSERKLLATASAAVAGFFHGKKQESSASDRKKPRKSAVKKPEP